MVMNLPKVTEKPINYDYFPTPMQAFIFRAWEFFAPEKIAGILGTTEENVKEEAQRMGLPPQSENLDIWMKNGYITIIRTMWHILPYDQLLELLGWTEEQLAAVLAEDDFLFQKLGRIKPDCEKVTYVKLTPEQIEKTKLIKESLEKHISQFKETERPFSWFEKKNTVKKKQYIKENSITLTSEWSVYDLADTENTKAFVSRFIKHIKETYDVSLNCGKSDKFCISVNCSKNLDCEEQHEIHVSDDKIEIFASDEPGILRALYYIEEMLSSNGCIPKGDISRKANFKTRFIYSFCGLYNNAFDVESDTYCPDALLEEYARIGVNGIWMQGILYQLTEFPFEKSISDGWQSRLAQLKKFSERAAKYGIKLYLYLNEPRCMPKSFFDDKKEIMGTVYGDDVVFCTSTKPVQDYLRNAVITICKNVPALGGFFTITASENNTNCYSRPGTEMCPRCAQRNPGAVYAEINNIIATAAHSVNPDIKTFAYNWAWEGTENVDVHDTIGMHSKDVILLTKTEEMLDIEISGIKYTMWDYTMAYPCPSDTAKQRWAWAKEAGLETAAKVQINNTWECSTVPYLPVYPYLEQHMKNLLKSGISHIMLGWTLGGYPSPNINLVSKYFFTNSDTDSFYLSEYGDQAMIVKKATTEFAKGFSNFPAEVSTQYFGPQNAGVSNQLFLAPTGYLATMTCFAYDSVQTWRQVFPVDVTTEQFGKICDGWKKGLDILSDMQDCEFKDISYACYTLFKSSYNQFRFIVSRDDSIQNNLELDKAYLAEIVRDELEMATNLYEIMMRNSSIGYEAANHYYFTRGLIAEKIVNCEYLLTKLK